MSSPQECSRRPGGRGVRTRSVLLESALESFASRGFHGTSTREIARAAGMSPAGVYAHFRTKEDMLYHLSLQGHEDVFEVVRRLTGGESSPSWRLRVTAGAFSQWHAEYHTQARVVQHELEALTPEHQAAVVALRRRTQGLFVDVVTAGASSGEFEVSNPGLVALSVMSLGIDVARWYRPGLRWTPRVIGEQYGELALRLAGYRTR